MILMPLAQGGALVVHLGLGYLYGVSGLGVPGIFLFSLWAAWGALLAVGVQHRHDWRYLAAVPLIAAILWATVALGVGSLLDWQA